MGLGKKCNIEALCKSSVCATAELFDGITGRHISVALFFCLDQDSVGFQKSISVLLLNYRQTLGLKKFKCSLERTSLERRWRKAS